MTAKKFERIIRAADKLCDSIDEYNEFVINACGDVPGVDMAIAGNTMLIMEALTCVIENIELEAEETEGMSDFDYIISNIILRHYEHQNEGA